MKKPNKMAAVREILSANPNASPGEIVSALASKKLKISIGVASNYKSVIRAGARKSPRKAAKIRASKSYAPTQPATSQLPAAPSTNGSACHGLEPAVVELLKAGKSLGWKKVRSIVDLMVS